MTATILSFGRRNPNTPLLPAKMPWQNQDLAELYRVRDRLAAAGMQVEVEAGVTDEGDPWFVYMQAGTDNAVVHIARIDSEIHVINCVTGGAYVGTSFREVSDRMLEEAPLALSAQVRRASNVVLHPSAFLTAFVAAALMLIDLLENNKAEAAPHHDAADAHETAAGVWTITTGSSHDTQEAHGAGLTAQGGTGGAEAGEAALHRRGLKDGVSPVVALSPLSVSAPVALAATGTGALSGHGGFLAEVPGVGASVTLAAGILAAELARSFSGEGEHGVSEAGSLSTEFAKDFASLLSAFVGAEPAHAKVALPELDQTASLLPAPVAPAGASGEAVPSAHVAVASVESLTAAVSVKSAPDGFVEQAIFVAPAAHKAMAPSSAPASAQAQSAVQAAVAAQEATRPAAASSEAAATVALSAVAASPVAATSSAGAAPVKADIVKDAAGLDLGWVVSQLVKHGAVAELTQTVAAAAPSTAKDSATQADSDISSSPGSTHGTTHLGLENSNAGLKGETASSESDKGDVAQHDAGKVDATKTASDPGANKTDLLPKAVDMVTLTPAGGTITLESGHHETLVYKAGSFLTVQNFVFGEDYLSFDSKLGDAMAAHARADGADLVLGDADTGTVRLVGVLADPALLSHLHDAKPSAA